RPGAGEPGSDDRAGRVPRAHGPLGQRQDDAAQPARGPGHPVVGEHPRRGRGGLADEAQAARGVARAARRVHLPALQPDPGANRAPERRAAAAAHAAEEEGAPRARGDGAAHRRPRGAHAPLPAPALGRPGAAGRHRARDRDRPHADPRRRADRRPGQQGRRGDPPAPRAAQHRVPEDDRQGHARPQRGRPRGPHAAPREGRAAPEGRGAARTGGRRIVTRATLVRANLRRRLRRTILTVLGLAVALFLFTTLRTFLHTLQTVGDVGSESRLVVSNKLGIVFPLPLAYRARLLSQDGVHTVSYASWFGSIYQDPRNVFANSGVDAETYLALYPEMVVSDEHREAFMADRTGALVGARLMERFGWTVGQTITLQGTIYPGEHRFTIRGVYEAGRRGFDESSLMFHHRYHDEIMRAQMGGEGFVGWYVLGVSDPDRAPAIAQAIDATYENSASPTRSQTEKAFNLAFVGMYGNIGFFLNAIGTAVVFAIL